MGWKSGFTFGTRAAIRDLTLRAKVVLADISHFFYQAKSLAASFIMLYPTTPLFSASFLPCSSARPIFAPIFPRGTFCDFGLIFFFLSSLTRPFQPPFYPFKPCLTLLG